MKGDSGIWQYILPRYLMLRISHLARGRRIGDFTPVSEIVGFMD